jgi:hypothetical protein
LAVQAHEQLVQALVAASSAHSQQQAQQQQQQQQQQHLEQQQLQSVATALLDSLSAQASVSSQMRLPAAVLGGWPAEAASPASSPSPWPPAATPSQPAAAPQHDACLAGAAAAPDALAQLQRWASASLASSSERQGSGCSAIPSPAEPLPAVDPALLSALGSLFQAAAVEAEAVRRAQAAASADALLSLLGACQLPPSLLQLLWQ